MIEVNNLVKKYGDHTAVDHLSFKIEKGKIYGFLGPNGAGKSTTLHLQKVRLRLMDMISWMSLKRQKNVLVTCRNSHLSISI